MHQRQTEVPAPGLEPAQKQAPMEFLVPGTHEHRNIINLPIQNYLKK